MALNLHHQTMNTVLRWRLVAGLGSGVRANWCRLFAGSAKLAMQHKGSFQSEDYTVESDEITTDNNPWSPTLYNDIVYIRKPGLIRSTAMDEKYRLSYSPLYEAPGAKYVSLLKRLSLSFAILGAYGGKLFYESVQFDDIYAVYTVLATSVPAVFIQYKTKDYVTRIWRLYDKTKPQTIDNLVTDENLIMEKLNMLGSKTYNQLLTVSNNANLKIVENDGFWNSYGNWQNGNQKYYVVDNIGGIKMDRLWGIVENNSNIDNGRYIENEIELVKNEN